MSAPEQFTCRAPHGTFVVEEQPDAIDVSLCGEFDLSSTDASQRVIEHVGELVGNTRRPVRVDMSSVSFFDAAGIRFLVQLRRIAEFGSTTASVQNPSPDVRRLLTIVGLERILKEP